MTTNEANDLNENASGMSVDTAPHSPPRSPAMASLAQWEERGNGPSAPAIVSVALSIGAIALGVLLVKNGVLAPRTLSELNDVSVRRGWAPFFDVSAVGTASVNAARGPASVSVPAATGATEPPPAAAPAAPTAAAQSPTESAPAASASEPVRVPSAKPTSAAPRASSPASSKPASDDPFAHLEEGATAGAAAPPPPRPTSPPVESAPRISAGKNTVAVPAEPSPPTPASPTTGENRVPPSNHGRSTWGGERTPAP